MKMLIALVFLASFLSSCGSRGNPVEIGKVTWGRDLDQALKSAKESGKPVFALFQEVPGCAGCKQFGREVLSDPKLVEEIESNFIPLLIPNNQGGKDAEVLKKFGEPAWNYQVVRFFDGEGKDLIPRKDRIWTSEALRPRMAAALKVAAKQMQTEGPEVKRIAFAQHCFWTGEQRIGAIDGVLQTEAGFLEGREVTLVHFDPGVISTEKLVERAKQAKVASKVYLPNPKEYSGAHLLSSTYRPAPASDQKKQLEGTRFAKLQLTPEQATKINAFARTDSERAISYLTESQKRRLRE